MPGNGKTNDPLQLLIGDSDAIEAVKEKIRLVAPTDARVLITGESGTGKTLVAGLIHRLHPQRRQHHFRRTNIGALVPSLAQSQLYGHVANAFTGAGKKSEGIMLEAHQGTLFLDEISTACEEVQIMLLNLLEIPVINPVGGSIRDKKEVDVRFIAASSLSPHELQNCKTFRKDLFFRIAEYVIALKPLRERKEDIECLTRHFIKKSNGSIRDKNFKGLKGIEPDALEMLTNYDWPGNVRELEHVIRAAMVESRRDPDATTFKKEWIHFSNDTSETTVCSGVQKYPPNSELCDGKIICAQDISCLVDADGERKIAFTKYVDWFRSEICRHALQQNGDNQTRAARMLGIDPGSLAKYRRFDPSMVLADDPRNKETLFRIYFHKI